MVSAALDQPVCAGWGVCGLGLAAGTWFRTSLVTPAERAAVVSDQAFDKLERLFLEFYTLPARFRHTKRALCVCRGRGGGGSR